MASDGNLEDEGTARLRELFEASLGPGQRLLDLAGFGRLWSELGFPDPGADGLQSAFDLVAGQSPAAGIAFSELLDNLQDLLQFAASAAADSGSSPPPRSPTRSPLRSPTQSPPRSPRHNMPPASAPLTVPSVEEKRLQDKLQAVFRDCDAFGDGMATIASLEQALADRGFGDEDERALLHSAFQRRSQNGFLSFESFADAVQQVLSHELDLEPSTSQQYEDQTMPSDIHEDAVLRMIFDTLDQRKVGYLSLDQMEEVWQQFGMAGAMPAELHQRLENVAGAERTITYDDFVRVMFAPAFPDSDNNPYSEMSEAESESSTPGTTLGRSTPDMRRSRRLTNMRRASMANMSPALYSVGMTSMSSRISELQAQLLNAEAENAHLKAAVKQAKADGERAAEAAEEQMLKSEALSKHSIESMEAKLENDLRAVRSALQDEVRQLQGQLTKAENALAQERKQRQEAGKELQTLRVEQRRLQLDNARLQDECAGAQARIDKLEAVAGDVSTLNSTLETTRREHQAISERNTNLTRELERVTSQYQQLQDEHDELKEMSILDTSGRGDRRLSKNFEESMGAVLSMEADAVQVEKLQLMLQERTEALERSKEQSAATIASLREELTTQAVVYSRRIEELQAQLTAAEREAQQQAATAEQVGRLRDELQRTEKERLQLSVELAMLEEQVQDLALQLRMEREETARMEEERKKDKAMIAELDAEVRAAFGEVQRFLASSSHDARLQQENQALRQMYKELQASHPREAAYQKLKAAHKQMVANMDEAQRYILELERGRGIAGVQIEGLRSQLRDAQDQTALLQSALDDHLGLSRSSGPALWMLDVGAESEDASNSDVSDRLQKLRKVFAEVQSRQQEQYKTLTAVQDELMAAQAENLLLQERVAQSELLTRQHEQKMQAKVAVLEQDLALANALLLQPGNAAPRSSAMDLGHARSPPAAELEILQDSHRRALAAQNDIHQRALKAAAGRITAMESQRTELLEHIRALETELHALQLSSSQTAVKYRNLVRQLHGASLGNIDAGTLRRLLPPGFSDNQLLPQTATDDEEMETETASSVHIPAAMLPVGHTDFVPTNQWSQPRSRLAALHAHQVRNDIIGAQDGGHDAEQARRLRELQEERLGILLRFNNTIDAHLTRRLQRAGLLAPGDKHAPQRSWEERRRQRPRQRQQQQHQQRLDLSNRTQPSMPGGAARTSTSGGPTPTSAEVAPHYTNLIARLADGTPGVSGMYMSGVPSDGVDIDMRGTTRSRPHSSLESGASAMITATPDRLAEPPGASMGSRQPGASPAPETDRSLRKSSSVSVLELQALPQPGPSRLQTARGSEQGLGRVSPPPMRLRRSASARAGSRRSRPGSLLFALESGDAGISL